MLPASRWLFSDCSVLLLYHWQDTSLQSARNAVQAKRRVYALKSGRKRSKPNNGKAATSNLHATLEPLPKWGVLLELLQVSLLKHLPNLGGALCLHASQGCLLPVSVAVARSLKTHIATPADKRRQCRRLGQSLKAVGRQRQ